MKIDSILELAAELDGRGLSLHIFNTSESVWAIHLYAQEEPSTCVTMEGDDLGELLETAISNWDS